MTTDNPEVTMVEYLQRALVDAKPSPWQQLIIRYAGDKKPCNCGCAYYDTEKRCQYGCEVNQHAVKDEIARKVLAELGVEVEQRPFVPYSPALSEGKLP